MTQHKLRLYSNSSLADYRDCPRLFFYKYIMEWRSDTRALPLIFGGAWHKAMDAVWSGFAKGDERNAIITAGQEAFLAEWTAGGMPAQLSLIELEEMEPRTPLNAFEMLVDYVTKRESTARDMELVDIERPFAVPLDPEDADLFYVGKIDKIARQRSRGKIIGLEHKTTTAYKKDKKTPFRNFFLDSFSPNDQVDGYLYALHMYYPGEVGGVWVDGALVHKTETGFLFIPIEKQMAQLDLWLWQTRNWIGRVENDMANAALQDDRDPYMASFPRNTNNCHKFGAPCPHLNHCRAWPNPLGKPLPQGFRREPWDPLEHLNRDRLPFKQEAL